MTISKDTKFLANRLDEIIDVLRETQLFMKRFDSIINVLLETARPAGKALKVRDKVRILADSGLRPIEIARILGISVTHVNVNLHSLRKYEKLQTGKKRIKRS